MLLSKLKLTRLAYLITFARGRQVWVDEFSPTGYTTTWLSILQVRRVRCAMHRALMAFEARAVYKYGSTINSTPVHIRSSATKLTDFKEKQTNISESQRAAAVPCQMRPFSRSLWSRRCPCRGRWPSASWWDTSQAGCLSRIWVRSLPHVTIQNSTPWSLRCLLHTLPLGGKPLRR